MSDKIELKFKPITEGLGFHPFSNGLPYTPVAKTPQAKTAPAPSAPQSKVAGAIAAGTPSFARNLPPLRTQFPQVAPLAPATPHRPLTQAVPTPSTPSASLLDRPKTQNFGFGYVLRRVSAYFMDTAINTGLCVSALSLGLIRQGIRPDELAGPGTMILSILFLLLFNWALITAQEIAFNTTLGKRLFGLQICGAATTLFLRSILFGLSGLFCGLGLLWALFDSQKRCWHDIAVDLQPGEFTQL